VIFPIAYAASAKRRGRVVDVDSEVPGEKHPQPWRSVEAG